MSCPIVVDVVDSQKSWLCLTTAGTYIPAIRHDCLVSKPLPVVATALTLGFYKSSVLSLCAVLFSALLGQNIIIFLTIFAQIVLIAIDT